MKVELRRLTPATEEGWATLFDLTADGRFEWILVGGQMMHVLAAEHGAESIRPTDDADVVVDVSVQPNGTEKLSSWLLAKDFDFAGASPDLVGHRFVRKTSLGIGEVAIDVLALSHVGLRASLTTVAPARTVEVPGSNQAFSRSRLIDVTTSDFADQNERSGSVRCPNLLGALILKAAATTIAVRDNPHRDWQDAALLLSVLADPLDAKVDLGKRDRQHLNRLRPLLDANHVGWENLSSNARRQGRTALSILIGWPIIEV